MSQVTGSEFNEDAVKKAMDKFQSDVSKKDDDFEMTKNSSENASIQREMPKYQSHKKVWALKIKEIVFDSDLAKEDGNRETDGSATITPEEEGYAPFKVDAAYCHKHKPQAGGYYVVYADGYKSWSPADVFEEGNTRI